MRENAPAFTPENGPTKKLFDIQIAADRIAAADWNETSDVSIPMRKLPRNEETDDCPQTWGCPSGPPDCNITDSGCTEQGCGTDPDMTCPPDPEE